MEGETLAVTKSLKITDIPTAIMQTKVLSGFFSSRELFKLRGVCGEWSDAIKSVWCLTVKEEMLE
jgi:hypothetical protein